MKIGPQVGAERIKMSNETATPEVGPDPSTILCRVIDVNMAIQNSFRRFLETEGKTLEDLANFIREEMSQVELFAPTINPPEGGSSEG